MSVIFSKLINGKCTTMERLNVLLGIHPKGKLASEAAKNLGLNPHSVCYMLNQMAQADGPLVERYSKNYGPYSLTNEGLEAIEEAGRIFKIILHLLRTDNNSKQDE
tara:strand:+ start:314 stop:631 length:318 start_codon:yes stop_codon:yes gene_type:complete